MTSVGFRLGPVKRRNLLNGKRERKIDEVHKKNPLKSYFRFIIGSGTHNEKNALYNYLAN